MNSESRHPNEPWLDNKEWEDGIVKSHNKGKASCVAALTAVWGLLSTLILIATLVTGTGGLQGLIIMGCFFLLPGLCIMLPYSIYLHKRWERFGDTTCRLVTFPGIVGAHFDVEIQLPKGIWPQNGVDAIISCNETKRGPKKSRTYTIWSDTKHLEDVTDYGDEGLWVPVSFLIPTGAYPTSIGFPNPSHHWQLEIKGDFDGVDMSYAFTIPVYPSISQTT